MRELPNSVASVTSCSNLFIILASPLFSPATMARTPIPTRSSPISIVHCFDFRGRPSFHGRVNNLKKSAPLGDPGHVRLFGNSEGRFALGATVELAQPCSASWQWVWSANVVSSRKSTAEPKRFSRGTRRSRSPRSRFGLVCRMH
jgi:hypothetical protein